MTRRCSARLPIGAKPVALPDGSNWLRYVQPVCSQLVGLVAVPDLTGPDRYACRRGGHLDDVLTQVRAAEARERGRRDADDDTRALLAEKLRDEARDEREPVEPVEAYG